MGVRRVQTWSRTRQSRRNYLEILRHIICVQSLVRRRGASARTMALRRFTRARTLQANARMRGRRGRYVVMRWAAIRVQTWARMTIARRAYFIALAEANEQAKMENQLAALKRKLEEEAEAREKMAADNRALQDRLTQVRLRVVRRVQARIRAGVGRGGCEFATLGRRGCVLPKINLACLHTNDNTTAGRSRANI